MFGERFNPPPPAFLIYSVVLRVYSFLKYRVSISEVNGVQENIIKMHKVQIRTMTTSMIQTLYIENDEKM